MALTDNIVSYWKLDESSGNASDSIGSNTLTNNGTATYSAGKINNGVVLSDSNNFSKTEFVKGFSPWNKGKKGVQKSTRKGVKQKPRTEETKLVPVFEELMLTSITK